MAGETTRQRYLEAVVAHMMSTGRTDLPLVALADAAGTSDRMLVYYFKTREALMTEAVSTARQRRRQDLAAALGRVPQAPEPASQLADVLRSFASADDTASLRFYFDACGQGFHDEGPFGDFLAGSIQDMVEEASLLARRLGADEHSARSFGTLFAALAPALGVDALATEDTDRVDAAIAVGVAALLSSLESTISVS